MFDIAEATRSLLNGCVIRSRNGTDLYTPDGRGNYRALWTRDFAYMTEYAGELIPPEKIRACLEYLMAGASADSWIPDRVDADGVPYNTAGGQGFPALPNLDNGPFLVIAADAYLSLLPAEQADERFRDWKRTLCRGVDCLPTDENGLVCNRTNPAHSPYGFTDCIRKTGLLAMESILLWRAFRILSERLGRIGESGGEYEQKYRKIERSFGGCFSEESGMLLAATECCRQTDVWTSCYAQAVGFPLPEEQKARIAAWLTGHADVILEGGQVRHLPGREVWQSTFVPVESGTYQNGAFWATASGWLCESVAPYDRAFAERLMSDVLGYFERFGIFECVSGGCRKLDTYVVSAANVYGAWKKIFRKV